MIKRLVFCGMFALNGLIATANAHGSSINNYDKLFCSVKEAKRIKPELSKLKGTDKLKHCTGSCAIHLECSLWGSFGVGLAKELADLLGAGNPEIADIKANIKGLRLANKGYARDFKECEQECRVFYP